MPTLSLTLPQASYPIFIEKGLLSHTGEYLKKAGIKNTRLALISDSHVAPLWAKTVEDSLQQAGFNVQTFVLPAGESTKCFEQIASLSEQLAAAHFDRKSTFIALGGGVVGDFVGFLASLYYRGVPFVQIPTTLLSQVDSSVGGKTGINLKEGKNLAGAFHHPSLVLIDPLTLETLPPRIFIEGLSEVIKHALIKDKDLFAQLEAQLPALIDFSEGNFKTLSDQLPDLLAQNIAIKAHVVEADEKETLGIRALLNLGHTIGHGLEASVDYGSLLHGECVSYGLRAALWLSVKKAGLPLSEAQRALDWMQAVGLPLVLPQDFDLEKAIEKMMRDKKFEAGAIRFVLLSALGQAFVSSEVSAEDLREAFAYLKSPVETPFC